MQRGASIHTLGAELVSSEIQLRQHIYPVRAEHAFPPTQAVYTRQLIRGSRVASLLCLAALARLGNVKMLAAFGGLPRFARPAALRAAGPRFARLGLALQVVGLCGWSICGEAMLQAGRGVT